jgi:hypothetical protein
MFSCRRRSAVAKGHLSMSRGIGGRRTNFRRERLISGDRGVSTGEDGAPVDERQSKDHRDTLWDPRLNTGVPQVARVYDYWLG